ncbi:MAG: hypothetical protein OXC55_06195 [Chloroflexi bacterium]|nr:hypothetical protein [Chloroflexota bacterium]
MRKLTILLMAIAMSMVLLTAACGSEDPTATPPAPDPTATSAPDDSMDDMEDQPRIVFSDLNWASAQLQNRIAQYILETGYGYETDVVFGATLPLLQGLRAGDTQITMEIWLPNQDAAWVDALAEGSVKEVGFSLGADWQSAFVIPRYLQEEYPELDSIEDLKDPQFKELFETPDSDGKARLVSCVIGWACEGVNDAQIAAYGLEDHVFAVKPGDGAAANADLYGAYERQEPWLGYQWGTNDPALLLDLVRLEEPAYTDDCWTGLQAYIEAGFDGPAPSAGCGYRDAEIKIAIRTELADSEPELVSVLESWSFDIPQYGTVVAWQQDNPNADIAESALWWLNNNQDEWSGWVTSDAEARITAALGDNVIPDGWPTE